MQKIASTALDQFVLPIVELGEPRFHGEGLGPAVGAKILAQTRHPGAVGEKPEVLAPAGDWDCIRAAIENGADAVYFGVQGFNARARAANFQVHDLPSLMSTLHRQGVKGYLTLNTLVFPSELNEIAEILAQAGEAGVDAIIVQDVGVARLAKATCPTLPIHASTQMTVTSAEGIALAEELGVARVVLARELSLTDIARIRRQTKMPLEVFVHGALCVAYSGQCLTSEALGGRSANRGQCAQACRLPYQVICDGKPVDLGAMQYLLSPQDLAAFGLVGRLADLKVASLKIEGRLKTADYVANITRHYRRAVDGAVAGQPANFSAEAVREMQLSFSRGFSPGWLAGDDHKALVPGISSSKRGVFLGAVKRVHKGRVLVQLAGPVKRGDGVVFEADRFTGQEQGGRVYGLFDRQTEILGIRSTGLIGLAFGKGDLDLSKINVGQSVWQTDDPELTRKLRKTYEGAPRRRVGLSLRVWAKPGFPLELMGVCENGATVHFTSDQPLPAAVRWPLTTEQARQELGRLAGSVYELRELQLEVKADEEGVAPMAPLSLLKKARLELVRRLDEQVSGRALGSTTPRSVDRTALGRLRDLASPDSYSARAALTPTLRVLCRTPAQFQAALEQRVDEIYLDFHDIREYGGACEMGRSAGAKIYLATPKIQKPAEGPLFKYLLKPKPAGILVRNLGGATYYIRHRIPLVGDHSLNIANSLSAQFFTEKGMDRVTASYDLTIDQLLDLAKSFSPDRLEVVIHQHMPMFHMEHCVFCAVLSPGTNRTNCGRPCDRHEVKLRDHVGMEHPLQADVGCRNTLFNAVPQSAAEHVPSLQAVGVQNFRVEFLEESRADASRTIGLYRDLLAGKISGKSVWSALCAVSRLGVTRGPLEPA